MHLRLTVCIVAEDHQGLANALVNLSVKVQKEAGIPGGGGVGVEGKDHSGFAGNHQYRTASRLDGLERSLPKEVKLSGIPKYL